MTDVIDTVAVDAALKQFTDMMATDGYVLTWSATGQTGSPCASRRPKPRAQIASCLSR